MIMRHEQREVVESSGKESRRRGIVLILSLGMLTLFTIVAITLASISRTQATAAANFKRAEQYGRSNAGVRPEQVSDLFRYAVNQLIYDTRNPQSAIRGHSLLRDMYGSPATYEIDNSGTIPRFEEIEENGAELRLRKSDLKTLVGLPATNQSDSDPRLLYQGVYNGTGLPLPTKIDFASYINATATPPGVDATQLRMSPAEIALQMAFPHMPLSVVPFGKTILPTGSGLLFQAMGSYPTPTVVGTNVGYWFPRFTLNYTVFDRLIGGQVAAVQRFRQETSTYPDGSMIMPERFYYLQGGRTGVRLTDQVGSHWFGADEDYDYPDINNMFLALERADGRTLIPSFHRPGILSQVASGLAPLALLDGTTITPPARMMNVNQMPWLRTDEMIQGNIPTDIRALVLRPRAADYDPTTLGIPSPKAGRFKEIADSFTRQTPSGPIVQGQDGLPDDLDGSGFIGDHPSELDVDTDGDGLNDAVWIDLGYRPIQVGDLVVKPLFAFKVLDLDGKLNLNVHGNMFRPNLLAGGTVTSISTAGQHSSHRGASVSEINPVHGLIIGDTPADATSIAGLTAPYRPVWFYDRAAKTLPSQASIPLTQLAGNATYPHPYQRIVEGFTDAAGNYHPGRWSSPAFDPTVNAVPGISGLDENGNFSPNLLAANQTLNFMTSGTAVPAETIAQNRVRSSLHSVGDGRLVIAPSGTLAPGIPATSSPLSPSDMVGVGRTLSPWSQVALAVSNGRTKSNLRWDDGNLLPLVINHPISMSAFPLSPIGSYEAPNVVSPWGVNTSLVFNTSVLPVTTVTDGGLVAELFTFDEALEVNPYFPIENDDFFFSAADLAALWRAGDIDGPSSTSRLTSLLSSQVVPRSTDVSTTSVSVTPPGYSREAYAKKRQQRMFTHGSWDLNRFSSPPGIGLASLGNFMGSSIPGGVRDIVEAFRGSPQAVTLASDIYADVLHPLLRLHSGAPVPSILQNQLTNLLPNPETTTPPSLNFPIGYWTGTLPITGAYNTARLAMEHLTTRRTADGRDFLIPYEVQMGRRFDLNRPMTAYALPTTGARNKLLRLPGLGTSTVPGMPEDNLSGADATIILPDVVDRERESMAQQLYVLLSIAAGLVGDDRSTTQLVDVKSRIAQARVLAQIAVNIVDYMDPDSVMTQMTFDPYLADGWSDNTGAAPVVGAPFVPGYPRLADGSIAPAFASPPTTNQWTAACTVIGFEMPDLVINETVSVVQESIYTPNATPADPNPSPVRNEVLNTWVELMNPWPGAPDPVSPMDASGNVIRGIRLFDPATAQPRFMVSITCPEAGITPLAPDPTTNGTGYRSMVRFDSSGGSTGPVTSDGYVLQAGATPTDPLYVPSRDGANRANASGTATPDPLATADYGYFVIGPDISSNIEANTTPAQKGYGAKVGSGSLLSGVDHSSAAALSQAVDYAATACGQVVPNSIGGNGLASAGTVNIDVKLYRLRNPFRVFDASANPYIAIDTVRMNTGNNFVVQEHYERGTTGSLSKKTPTATTSTGIYYAPDMVTPDMSMKKPATWDPNPNVANRNSWQRRQPWHGWNSEFDPYDLRPVNTALTTHPLADVRLGTGGLSNRRLNLEGLYLGLPSLAAARDIDNPAELYPLNAMRQNGFVPLPPTLAYSRTGTVSTRATTPSGGGLNRLERWQRFPFANHQVATPLELLNVRLYGSHMWEPAGGINEWRLRFTDDCEFMTAAYAMPDAAGLLPTDSYFERTWRSRPIPWFQSDRLTHPTWGRTATDFNLNAYDPANLRSQITGREQLQLPLGNLYRFFEFVECRSKLSNGSKVGEQWVQDDLSAAPNVVPPFVGLSGSQPVLRTNRQDRVAGKINLNTITEEEVYKGLIDSVSAMYFDPAEYVTLVTNYRTNSRGPSAITAGMTAYWPSLYWEGLFTALGQYPLSNPNTGETVDMLGDVVPWRSLSFAQMTEASVLTPPGAPGTATARIASIGGMDLAGAVGLTTSLAVDWESSTPTPLMRLIHSQWPGIATGPLASLIYPGTSPDHQVSSEMYRVFLMSRAGADGITGTADDRPFRSFASLDVEETILRSRSPQIAGSTKPATVTVDATGAALPDWSDQTLAVARTWIDSANDITTNQINVGGASYHLSLGGYNIRLGGQVVPRLFEPVDHPYMDDPSVDVGRGALYLLATGGSFVAAETQANAKLKYQRPTLDTAGLTDLPRTLPVDYWMLDEKRNSLLAKIAGNTTTRSHVFAAWVTVGFFRVEPGTENLKVPLLGAEVGSENNRAKRHRAFFVIDRSQATEYEPEDIDANYDLDRLQNRKLLDYYKIIE
jgi:hypothetical protein